jgi:hypothetical protein
MGDKSFWGDVHVGHHDDRMGSARCVWESSDLSENREEYWYHNRELDFGGTINKDTAEGRKLTAMIKKGRSQAVVEKFALHTLLANITGIKMLELLASARKTGREEGAAAMRRKFKELMDI